MLSIKTILAPVDFSERTELEAQNAADIARHFGSRLILLHAIPQFAEMDPVDPAAAAAYSHEFSAEVEKGIDEALHALASRVAGGVEVECVVLSGGPVEKIGEFAMGREIDLVVIPTSGTGRVQRQLFGSVATRLLENMNCAVWTGVHPSEGGPGRETPYKRVACKVEPGELLPERVRWARDFAAAYDASLSVVGVLPFLDSLGAPPSTPEPFRDKALADATEEIQALCNEEAPNAAIAVLGGPIDSVLPHFIRTNEIDLLVSGPYRHQDRVGALGFHTDIIDTTQSVPCPMVLV